MSNSKHRTPIELINLYWDRVWNNREVELIREICADPIYRHDACSTTALSHDEQVNRVTQQARRGHPQFSHEVLLANDEYVCSVWNMVTSKGAKTVELSGIEVFRAENGRFTNCWNSTYVPGLWGKMGDKSVTHDLPPPQLLESVKQIDIDWIQRVLQHSGIEAPRVSLITNDDIGAGNLSSTVRTRISYNADATDFPAAIICKFHPTASAAVKTANLIGTGLREIESYRALSRTEFSNMPKLYWADSSETGDKLNLVIQDMSKLEIGDQVKGCSIPQAHAVNEALIALHQLPWSDPKLDDQKWLFNRAAKAEGLAKSYIKGAEIFLRRYQSHLSPNEFAVIDELIPMIKDCHQVSTDFKTISHGEPRVDNVIFDMHSTPAKAYLIDWQFTDCQSPMSDLAYFCSGSLTTADRRTCENELISLHHQAMYKLNSEYSLATAKEEYAFHLIFGLAMTIGAAVSVAEGEQQDQLLVTLAQRNCAAISDWNSIALAQRLLAAR